MRKFSIALAIGLIAIGIYSLYPKLFPQIFSGKSIPITIQIKRLEKELFACQEKQEIQHFLQENQQFSQHFLGIHSTSDQEVLREKLYQLVQDTAMHKLYQEVAHVFEDLTTIQQQLSQAFGYLHACYPQYAIPQVATFITGMGSDLYLDQELIVMGLDFFLGENAQFKPALPQYIVKTYQPAFIVPKLLVRLANQFTTTMDQDHTLLNDMLASGKAYYFAKSLLPALEDHMLLGYTKKQLVDIKDNQHIVWEHFIEHKLLYETNHLIKRRYLGDKPFTPEIGPGCPGNIGGWLGWEIIKKYMQRNPKISLPALLQNTAAQDILVGSKYRPKRGT